FMLFTSSTKLNASTLELEQPKASRTKSVVIESNCSENYAIGTTSSSSHYLKKSAEFAFSCGKTLVTTPWKILNYAYNHPKQVLALGVMVLAVQSAVFNPIGTYFASISSASVDMQVVPLNNFSNSSLTPYYSDSYFYRNDSNFCYDSDRFDDSEETFFGQSTGTLKGWKHPSEESKQWAEQYTKLIKAPSIQSILPLKIDLRELLKAKQWPVYQQGNLGSCVANAAAAAIWFDECREGIDANCINRDEGPSRLMIYFEARALFGDTDEDTGTSNTAAIQALTKFGVCKEKIWTYDTSQFRSKPPKECYDDTVIAIDDYPNDDVLHSHMRVDHNIAAIKGVLSQGYPVLFGIKVYSSFDCNDGIIPMPRMRSDYLRGGHAVLLVGYVEEKEAFIFRNSWGKRWGNNGYCQIPYQYVGDAYLAHDFWVIKSVRKK
ncbi:MAG: C1 family peptidase, partial [Alphaproteobacteria bacterium]